MSLRSNQDVHNFNVNDEVRVIKRGLASYGRTGIVERVDYPYNGVIVVNLTDSHKSNRISIRHEKLSPMNVDCGMAMSEDDELHLAFIHFHDGGQNPTSISDAVRMFSTDELGQPELTVYGTKDDIIKEIEADGEIHSYENCFIILGTSVYPVKKEIKVDW